MEWTPPLWTHNTDNSYTYASPGFHQAVYKKTNKSCFLPQKKSFFKKNRFLVFEFSKKAIKTAFTLVFERCLLEMRNYTVFRGLHPTNLTRYKALS